MRFTSTGVPLCPQDCLSNCKKTNKNITLRLLSYSMCHIYSYMLYFLIYVLYRLPFPSACEWWMIQFSLSQLMKISWILNIFFWIVVLFVVAIVWNRMHKSHVCFEKLWYDVVHPRESQYVPVSDIPEYDNKKGLVHYES